MIQDPALSQLIQSFNQKIKGVTPGFKVRAFQGDRMLLNLEIGEVFEQYDLASLTKIIFTTTALMHLVTLGKLKLDDPVSRYLSFFSGSSIKVKQLLNHSSGLLWWSPFYNNIKDLSSLSEKNEILKRSISELAKKVDSTQPLKSVYSDVGFLTLGFLLQEINQKPLLDIFNDLKEKKLMPLGLHFNPLGEKKRFSQDKYAPTQEESTDKNEWRHHRIQGEVNDENTWALGGVAPHAGLFGSMDDVSQFYLMIRDFYFHGSPFLKKDVIAYFLSRSVEESVGDWALGWMMPTIGSASCGNFFSKESVGHTGFTGTSLWWDLSKDFSILILSNRTILGKDKKDFPKLRPIIHDEVCQYLYSKGVFQ